MIRVKECLTKETQLDTVLVVKMLQSKLSVAHTVRIPAGEGQGLPRFVLLRRVGIFGYEQNKILNERSRMGCRCVDGGYGCEELTSQVHKCLDGKAIEEIRKKHEGGVEIFGGENQV